MPALLKLNPIAYLVDSQGRRTHAVIPMDQLRALQASMRPSDSNPIRLARHTANLTQTELASALGISQAMLSKQEQQGRALRPRTIKLALDAIRSIHDPKKAMTLQQVVEAYGEVAKASLPRKRRHPTERALLTRAGETSVRLETERRTKAAGARATRTETRQPK